MKTWNHRPKQGHRHQRPALRFTPLAFSKLVHLRDSGPTEIGGFGISLPNEPLVIADVALVPQACTAVTTSLDDAGVADYFDEQVDSGRRPEEFARIWVHTHPGTSPRPSQTDEATFARVFDASDWAVMFILARGGATYARLRFSAGPGGQLQIPVEVDFRREFAASDRSAWDDEYQKNVYEKARNATFQPAASFDNPIDNPIDGPFYSPFDRFRAHHHNAWDESVWG